MGASEASEPHRASHIGRATSGEGPLKLEGDILEGTATGSVEQFGASVGASTDGSRSASHSMGTQARDAPVNLS